MKRLRVATVPDDHPYLDAALPADVDRVHFPVSAADPWAPTPLLDVDTLTSHAADIDLVHLHFGYESLSAAAMTTWTAAVRGAGLGLVVTVHDLRNPHDVDRRSHDRHLDILLAAADEVSTLTPGAAAELQARHGREVGVLPHPTLAGGRRTPRPPRTRPVVGVHLKSLRTNIHDPGRLVLVAADGAGAAGATLRVDLHPEVVNRRELSGVRAAAADGRIDLRVHERFDDAALEAYLGDLDVSVLPYRFGSHSGWLELCRDLGTNVVVPDCGFYAEQWPAATVYGNNEVTGLDGPTLAAAVEKAVQSARGVPADPVTRAAEREHSRQLTAAGYRRAVRARVAVS